MAKRKKSKGGKSKDEVIERLQGVVDDLKADVAEGNAPIPLAGATVTLRAKKGDPTQQVAAIEGGEFRQRLIGTEADRFALADALRAAVIEEPPVDPEEDDDEEAVV